MWIAVIIDVLAGVGCLAMAGYGLVIVLISQIDPLHPDDVGMALGSALLGTFLIVPVLSIVSSIRLASTNLQASIAVALAPFAVIAVAVVVLRAIPWPSPPPPAERVVRYPDTPETYVWRLSRWRL